MPLIIALAGCATTQATSVDVGDVKLVKYGCKEMLCARGIGDSKFPRLAKRQATNDAEEQLAEAAGTADLKGFKVVQYIRHEDGTLEARACIPKPGSYQPKAPASESPAAHAPKQTTTDISQAVKEVMYNGQTFYCVQGTGKSTNPAMARNKAALDGTMTLAAYLKRTDLKGVRVTDYSVLADGTLVAYVCMPKPTGATSAPVNDLDARLRAATPAPAAPAAPAAPVAPAAPAKRPAAPAAPLKSSDVPPAKPGDVPPAKPAGIPPANPAAPVAPAAIPDKGPVKLALQPKKTPPKQAPLVKVCVTGTATLKGSDLGKAIRAATREGKKNLIQCVVGSGKKASFEGQIAAEGQTIDGKTVAVDVCGNTRSKVPRSCRRTTAKAEPAKKAAAPAAPAAPAAQPAPPAEPKLPLQSERCNGGTATVKPGVSRKKAIQLALDDAKEQLTDRLSMGGTHEIKYPNGVKVQSASWMTKARKIRTAVVCGQYTSRPYTQSEMKQRKAQTRGHSTNR
jgi:hypothetical protein